MPNLTTLPIPRRCINPDCESELIEWHLGTRVSNHAAMSGRMIPSDMVARLYLACGECGEMLFVVEDDGVLNEQVIAPPPIVVKVQPPAAKYPGLPPLHQAVLLVMDPSGGNPTSRVARQLDHPEWKIQPVMDDLAAKGLIEPGSGGSFGWHLVSERKRAEMVARLTEALRSDG